MATIRKRGSRWEAQVRRSGLEAECRTFARKADAETWANSIEAEIASGTHVNQSLAKHTTLGEVLQRYLAEVTPEKKGKDAERYQILALLRDPIALLPLTQLTPARLAEWRNERLQDVSGSTVNRQLNLLSHALNVARREWGIAFMNPVGEIRRPRQNRARKRRISPVEEARLLSSLEQGALNDEKGRLTPGCRNPWMRPLCVMAIETSMRRNELLALEWEHVDLDNRVALVLDSKNGESREVPLSTRACEELAKLPRTGPRVFDTTPEAVKKAFTRAVKRAGLTNLHFHDLRHEATSRLSKKLPNVIELSAVTGHKTLSMLARYYHPTAADLAKKIG